MDFEEDTFCWAMPWSEKSEKTDTPFHLKWIQHMYRFINYLSQKKKKINISTLDLMSFH